MSAIPAAAHDWLVLLRRAYDEASPANVDHAGGRYRDAVTMAALMSGQDYEAIDAAVRAVAEPAPDVLCDTGQCGECWGCRKAAKEDQT